MQDKSYAIAIVVVLGICCLGVYVAISGFLNSNPSPWASSTPVLQATSIVIDLPTDTPAPTVSLAVQTVRPTSVPVPSPLGAFQTITAATTSVIPSVPPAPTLARPATPTVSSPATQSCAGFPFCWKYGVPDATLGPTGNECPRNYIWGLVTDANGKGLPNVRIRHLAPNGEYGETLTKDRPDVPGKYDILAPSGTFVIWIVSGGAPQSPRVSVPVQPHTLGSKVCLMRIDFFQQK